MYSGCCALRLFMSVWGHILTWQWQIWQTLLYRVYRNIFMNGFLKMVSITIIFCNCTYILLKYTVNQFSQHEMLHVNRKDMFSSISHSRFCYCGYIRPGSKSFFPQIAILHVNINSMYFRLYMILFECLIFKKKQLFIL